MFILLHLRLSVEVYFYVTTSAVALSLQFDDVYDVGEQER